jgi:thymidylate kinase
MDEVRAGELLASLANAVPGGFVLWRGADLGGSDVDVVCVPGRETALADALTAQGLRRLPRAGGRAVWTEGDAARIDVLDAGGWPAWYPPLEDVIARANPGPGGALVAAPADQLLVFGADAVAGRPLARLADRCEAALAELAVVSTPGALGSTALAKLARDPARMRARARRGRLPWRDAATLALRDPAARRAFAARRSAAVGARAPGRRRGLLIAFSGMDGSGKSTAARVARDRIEAAGFPAVVEWTRLGQEAAVQDRIARPVKRFLGSRGTVADPVAATIGADREAMERRQVERRTGPVAWAWTLVVALVGARAHRRAVRRRRDGTAVVCDRWLADSLVDLEVRYGRHAAAARLLRLLVPAPDLGVLLAIDAATSLERKPGDQAASVVQRMEGLYAQAAGRGDLVVVDARRPLHEVMDEVTGLVDGLTGNN